jgi:hypothetical protein
MKQSVAIAFIILCGYWFLSMMYHEWSIPIVSLPVLGNVVSFYPFQFLDTFALFLGFFITAATIYFYRSKKKHA